MELLIDIDDFRMIENYPLVEDQAASAHSCTSIEVVWKRNTIVARGAKTEQHDRKSIFQRERHMPQI